MKLRVLFLSGFVSFLISLPIFLGGCGGTPAASPSDTGASDGDSTDGAGDGTTGGTSGGTTADTTAPTLSVAEIDQTEMTSGQTTALTSFPTSVSLDFSEAMTTSTVLDTSNITLSAEGTETIAAAAATDTDGISDNEFTLTLEDPWIEMETYTLTVGTGVQDASANELGSAATYSFTTPCASDVPYREEFRNEASLSGSTACWQEVSPSSWTRSISQANGTMTATLGSAAMAGGSEPGFRKSFSNTNLTAEVKFTDATGIDSSVNVDAGLFFRSIANDASLNVSCTIVPTSALNQLQVYLTAPNLGAASAVLGSVSSLSTITGGRPLYIRMVKAGNQFSCQYRIGDTGNFTDLTFDGTNPVRLTLNLGSPYYFYPISMRHLGASTIPTTVTVDSVTLE